MIRGFHFSSGINRTPSERLRSRERVSVRFKKLVGVRRPSGAPTIIDRISGFFSFDRGSPKEVTFLNSWSPGIVYKTKGSIGSRVDYTVDKKCKASQPREKERLRPTVLAAPPSLVATEELARLFLFPFLFVSLSLSLFFALPFSFYLSLTPYFLTLPSFGFSVPTRNPRVHARQDAARISRLCQPLVRRSVRSSVQAS